MDADSISVLIDQTPAPSKNVPNLSNTPSDEWVQGTHGRIAGRRDDEQESWESFMIYLYIFELRGLQGSELRPFVRVTLNGRKLLELAHKETRSPEWNEYHCVEIRQAERSMRNQSIEFSVRESRGISESTLIGSFKCTLNYIYHQADHAIVGKWLALNLWTTQEEMFYQENAADLAVKGYLKASICMRKTYEQSITRALLIPKAEDRNLISDILSMNLLPRIAIYVNIFKILDLPCEVSTQNAQMRIDIELGGQRLQIRRFVASSGSAIINEQIVLPSVWPGIADKMVFRLVCTQRETVLQNRRKSILAVANLHLSKICHWNRTKDIKRNDLTEQGFLTDVFLHLDRHSLISIPPCPTHLRDGLNQKLQKSVKEIGFNIISEFIVDPKFFGRLLLAVVCKDEPCQTPARNIISSSLISSVAQRFPRKFVEYILYSTFVGTNLIHKSLQWKNIHFQVSIGPFGNDLYDRVQFCVNRTLSVQPAFAGCDNYAIEWANRKPVCEILCSWEVLAFPIKYCNFLQKILTMLVKYMEIIETESCDDCETFSLVTEIIESIRLALELKAKGDAWDIHNLASIDHFHISLLTALRETIVAEFDSLKFVRLRTNSNAREMGINFIRRTINHVQRLQFDDEITIPNLILLMRDKEKIYGFTRIAINEVTYDVEECYRGVKWNSEQIVELKWLERSDEIDENSIPGVVNLRIWFGIKQNLSIWKKEIETARLCYYLEAFENQIYSKNIWRATTGAGGEPFPRSDELGITSMQFDVKLPTDWTVKGAWMLTPCHETWVGPDAGHLTYEEEFYELEERMDNKWKLSYYADKFDVHIKNPFEQAQPSGWKWSGEWSIDLYCAGDEDGWSYLQQDTFTENAELADLSESATHKYRRRRWKRLRAQEKVVDSMEFHKLYADQQCWEYAAKFKDAFHSQQLRGDRCRRRRYVQEICPSKNEWTRRSLGFWMRDQSVLPRIYEIYEHTMQWQMHSTVLWSRSSTPSWTSDVQACVRIAFMTRCKQTAFVEASLNPEWSETLIFDRILLCGAEDTICESPPEIIIEMYMKQPDGSEELVGRSRTFPHVSQDGRRHKPSWFSIKSDSSNTGCALLASFEMFQYAEKMVNLKHLPKLKPGGSRYEASKEVLPMTDTYNVYFFFWGLRNVYHQWFGGNPIVELQIGRRKIIVDNTKSQAGCNQSLFMLSNVQLARESIYAQPFTLILYRNNLFSRRSKVGVSLIKDYMKLNRTCLKAKSGDAVWNNFNSSIKKECPCKSPLYIQYQGEDWPIDWWSVFHGSIGDSANSPGFSESGIEKINVYATALEDVAAFSSFRDFTDTFIFKESSLADDAGNHLKCGELKGKIYVENKGDISSHNPLLPYTTYVPSTMCVVRVYLVRALELTGFSRSQCAPYAVVEFGKENRISLRKSTNLIGLNPIFGQMVEMEVDIWNEKDLTIKMMQKNRFLNDTEIGRTTIDLENRLHTRHRATVGLPKQYFIHGPFGWRDQITPMEILKCQCINLGWLPPEIETNGEDFGLKMLGNVFWWSNIRGSPKMLEFTGDIIQQIALFILNEMNLVPEYVETRTLTQIDDNELECGKLQMFVDIMPIDLGPIPPPIDISLRVPKKYQLRAVVWNVKNASVRNEFSRRKPINMYVKCFLYGSTKQESTDIHYRRRHGDGSFHWRFVLDFSYDIWTKKFVHRQESRVLGQESERYIDPYLIVQIWDSNKFWKDGCIGELCLNLADFVDGQQLPPIGVNKIEKSCIGKLLSLLQCEPGTDLSHLTKKMDKSEKSSKFSLFQQRYAYGWWPCHRKSAAAKTIFAADGYKKKDDDYESKAYNIGGFVELELSLLDSEIAKKEPVGKRRQNPNHSPYLPPPKREFASKFWLLSYVKQVAASFWDSFGRPCCFRFLTMLFICVLGLTLIMRIMGHFLPIL